MVEIAHAGLIASPESTQEQSDRVLAFAEPLARLLLSVPEDDFYNVMGGLCMTFALRFDDPEQAFINLAKNVLQSLPEAIDNICRKPN